MDPVSALSLTGSVLGVAEIIAKCLKGLVRLQAKYKSADMVVTIIIGHLTTVKSALGEIHNWAEQLDEGSESAGFLSDLDTATGCCAIISEVLYEKIGGLERSTDQALTVKGKLTYMLGEKAMKEMSTHLSNQVQALNLLVTAAHCKTIEERNQLLRDTEARSALKRIKDDSSSCVQRGYEAISMATRGSAISGKSRNTSLFESDFEFESQLLSSQVYKRAFLAWLKQLKDQNNSQIASKPKISFRRRQPSEKMPEIEEEPHRNGDDELAVENQKDIKGESLKKYVARLQQKLSPLQGHSNLWKSMRPTKLKNSDLQKMQPQLEVLEEVLGNTRELEFPTVNVLLLGASGSGKTTFVKDLKRMIGDDSTIDFLFWREIIWDNILTGMETVLKAMKNLEIPLEDDENDRNSRRILMSGVQHGAESGFEPTWEICLAIIQLRNDEGVRECMKRSQEYQLDDALKYFLPHVERIMHPTYVPTHNDITRASIRTTGIHKTTWNLPSSTLQIFDVGGARSEQYKWTHCFYEKTAIVFVVDLGGYDQQLYEDHNKSKIQDDLDLFRIIIKSRRCRSYCIILFLNKFDKLKERLAVSPLQDLPPETTPEEAVQHIKLQFLSEAPNRKVLVFQGDFDEGTMSPALEFLQLYQDSVIPHHRAARGACQYA